MFTLIAVLVIWIVGFGLTFWFHIAALPMVEPRLALTRSAVWPYYLATGKPRGTPLPMD